MDVKKEQIQAAIDQIATLVVESIAEKEKKDSSIVLADFLTSQTGRKLYDESLKFWCDGPSCIEEMYRKEKGLESRST
ncbi:hypothetical protein B7988_06760 [Fibrobacter sp. UWB1]|uniref:hypothetical protein n=1 Tax=Fibrobacter sp. UWB1 TaxID=1964355 RepID=UPI000B51E6E1|nr:hypothetical protein [Fibrobacter sp. UWB1]OWV26283.1 hypothetical protein B7988_06760 [Fibrobacter sp. UWB1]